MRNAKADRNQPEIVAALRKVGASVQHLHTIGKGCPDILVGIRGLNLVMEIKDGKAAPSDRRLTADESKWHAEWRGQVLIVNSIDEALAAVGAMRKVAA